VPGRLMKDQIFVFTNRLFLVEIHRPDEPGIWARES
jgi:hypothetical protein